MSPDDIASNLETVKETIKKALREAKRPDDGAQLVAVSKTFDAEKIVPALEAGHKVFGENKVQEAQGKWPTLKEQYEDVCLHLIGPLQTNKAKDAVELFDVIETVDRPKLAEKLKAACETVGKSPKFYVQVNTGEEEQKAGVAPQDAVAFVTTCREEIGLPISGLMCIPPAEDYPAPHFALLEKLAREAGLNEISMGMSADYEIACNLGATHVRVGSAIFGARK